MSYRYDSEMVILNKLDKAGGFANAELYETYDRLRDLAVSGPAIGGSGLGTFGSWLLRLARVVSPSSFAPILGGSQISIPGTSYYGPINGATGTQPGSQSSFGLGPWGQAPGFPSSGSAAGFDPYTILSQNGFGTNATSQLALGGLAANLSDYAIGGHASSTGSVAGAGLGVAAGAGFGRSWLMPLAGIVSGLGGLVTSLSPFAGARTGLGLLLSGIGTNALSSAMLSSYNYVGGSILANADVTLSSKIKNLEVTIKQLDAQKDVLKKSLKDSLDGAKKAIQDLG